MRDGTDKPPDRLDRALKRGSLVSALGVVGRLFMPIFFVVATRLYGAATMDSFMFSWQILELVAAIAIAGFADGVAVLASRYADHDPDRAYAVLATGGLMAVAFAGVLLVVGQLVIGPLVHAVFEQHTAAIPGLKILFWSLVPRAIFEVSIASTKAHLRMESDAFLKGTLRPLLMLVGTVVAWLATGDIYHLFVAILAAECLVCVAGIYAMSQDVSVSRVLRTALTQRPDRETIRFSLPQGLSLGLHNYIMAIDQLMLAAFGVAEATYTWYGVAAELAKNLRMIRQVFSNPMGPIYARHHAAGDRAAIEALLQKLSRWTTTLVVLALLPLIVIRNDVLSLASPAFANGDSTFVLVLLILPFLNCALGLAGNALVFAGRSRWGLANNLFVAGLNMGLNWFLIPRYGLLGAAIASVIASAVVFFAMIFELRWLEGIRWPFRGAFTPTVAFALAAVPLALVWDPASLAAPYRAAAAAGVVLVFLILLLAFRHEEAVGLMRRRHR